MKQSMVRAWLASVCCASVREAMYLQGATVGRVRAEANEVTERAEQSARPAS